MAIYEFGNSVNLQFQFLVGDRSFFQEDRGQVSTGNDDEQSRHDDRYDEEEFQRDSTPGDFHLMNNPCEEGLFPATEEYY